MTLLVEDLHLSYGRRKVLRGAGFAAPVAGALVALIGPNAAGKSSLFRSVTGMARIDAGKIRLDDVDLTRVPPRQRARLVSFMPQSFASNAALTVFEVVLLARKQLAGWRVGQDDLLAVSALLERMGIAHLAAAPVGELSGGQSQLVSAAQALIRTPRVFLFDEPTSALDLRRQLELLGLIRDEAKARNIAAFIALHDLNLAARFADECVLMRRGRVVAQGPSRTVLPHPELAGTYGVSIELLPRNNGGFHVCADL